MTDDLSDDQITGNISSEKDESRMQLGCFYTTLSMELAILIGRYAGCFYSNDQFGQKGALQWICQPFYSHGP